MIPKPLLDAIIDGRCLPVIGAGFSKNAEIVVGTAWIRWNIGEIQWLEASYPAMSEGIIRVIDPDMNLDPEEIDSFNIHVWSDSDPVGIELTVYETNEATGIFEGIVAFNKAVSSKWGKLKVAEGDKVYAKYVDTTLPSPYTINDSLEIIASTIIKSVQGEQVNLLARLSLSNICIVDEKNNLLNNIRPGQPVKISANVTNNQGKSQTFTLIIQIEDENGVVVDNLCVNDVLEKGKSSKLFLPWTPESSGSYVARIFVWGSIDDLDAMSPPMLFQINVS